MVNRHLHQDRSLHFISTRTPSLGPLPLAPHPDQIRDAREQSCRIPFLMCERDWGKVRGNSNSSNGSLTKTPRSASIAHFPNPIHNWHSFSRWIVGPCQRQWPRRERISGPILAVKSLSERLPARLRRRFQLRVFFLADFETDGFRAQRRLHHVPASSLAITAETSSRA